jgi:Methylamine utilisation protein MauE
MFSLPFWLIALSTSLGKTAGACILITSGCSKLGSPGKFVTIVRKYGLLPSRAQRPFAYFLIAVELCLGVELLRPRFSFFYLRWPVLSTSFADAPT